MNAYYIEELQLEYFEKLRTVQLSTDIDALTVIFKPHPAGIFKYKS
jgi:hypothetical protein